MGRARIFQDVCVLRSGSDAQVSCMLSSRVLVSEGVFY